MEYHSWTNTGVPEEAAWELDDEVVVMKTTMGITFLVVFTAGNLNFGLFPNAAPNAVSLFKKGVKERLFVDCTFTKYDFVVPTHIQEPTDSH